MHFVYILSCADGTLYTGYTTELDKRLAEHNGIGDTKTATSAGAKYTRGRRPVKLVYSEKFKNRSEAMQREYVIKCLTRREKIEMIQSWQGNSLINKIMAKGMDRKKEKKKPKKDKKAAK